RRQMSAKQLAAVAGTRHVSWGGLRQKMLVVRRAIAHSGQPEFGEACLGKSKNPVMTREVGVLIERSFEKPGD
ncbi:MAG: hypothetical protein Q8J72_07905, partial [Rhodocyclaceae bacterium]|nr:hypothetical protein [Rhodocyclaceae bacterium]